MTRAELPERIETERLGLLLSPNSGWCRGHPCLLLVSPESSTQVKVFSTRQDLEDDIYYLVARSSRDRNQKKNLPAGYGIVVKGNQ